MAAVNAVTRIDSLLVLGGSSEIGLATATELARRGASRIILAGRDPGAMSGAVAGLKQAGASAVEALQFDATAVDRHGAFVDEVFDRFGDIDAVLIAFGVLGDQLAQENDEVAAVEVITTNFTGAVAVAIPVIRRFKRQGHGCLAVLSSVAAERPRRSNFIYSSSKAGLDAFFQGLVDSLVDSGIEVLVVRPGFVHTKMTAGRPALPFSTTPDKVGTAVAAAMGKGSGTIWVPAQLRLLMSGLRHLPRTVFRRLDA